MGANPVANGGLLLQPLELPIWRDCAVDVPAPGAATAEPTRTLGRWLKGVIEANATRRNFRIFGPDETVSNRLTPVFDVTPRQWEAAMNDGDEFLGRDGRVMEVLSEHQCQGWLEGYLLTGRHGLFDCYEAFVHIVDSMFNQHAKWLEVTDKLPWRRPIASLNYLLASHVWQQDHNGFTHQDPRLHRRGAEQKAGGRACLPAAGRELPAQRLRSLFADQAVRQRGGGRQAPRAAMAGRRRGGEPLRGGPGHLGLGQQRPGNRPRPRDGLRRRRADARNPRRRFDPARRAAGRAGARRERRGPAPPSPPPTATRTARQTGTSTQSSPPPSP